MTISGKLTVYFDQQFYQGILEQTIGSTYQVAKVTFGTQAPSVNDLLRLVNQRWAQLHWTKPSNGSALNQADAQNPKRRSRQARKTVAKNKRQQATAVLKLEHQRNLVLKKQRQRANKQAHEAAVRLKKQAKHRAKHQGH
ncbi:MAG: YjdF family protein [Lactobacillus sp.]|nr:YjdF family protein [Lactobacillus sp.]